MKLKLAILLLSCFALVLLFHKSATVREQPIISHNQSPIPAMYNDKALFLSPIKQVKSSPSPETITGLTVPHHLLVSDLIAKAFNFASRGKYNRIILLSPDHFNLGDSNVSTTQKNFLTVFGEIKTDAEAVEKLKILPFIHKQDFFYREHGVQAELPFIKYYFPEAKIIALTFKATTPKAELEQVIAELKKILTAETLVIQSTDFSHYLTAEQANIKDAETIKILEQADAEKLFTLNQPDNLDSIAAQYVQTRLQIEFFGSKLSIIDHKNSQDYTKEKVASSTSYIVEAYIKQPH
jgi:AmmeMemoRadiSam system protein B